MSRTERFVGRTPAHLSPSLEYEPQVKLEPLSVDESVLTEEPPQPDNLDQLIEIKNEFIEEHYDDPQNHTATTDDPEPEMPPSAVEPAIIPNTRSRRKGKSITSSALKEVLLASVEVSDETPKVNKLTPKLRSPPPLIKLAHRAPPAKKDSHPNQEHMSPPFVSSDSKKQPSKSTDADLITRDHALDELLAGCVVSKLMNGFGGIGWTEEQMDHVVRRGKPFPLVIETDARSRNLKKHHDTLLTKVSWLTSSLEDNKYSCWPCLLLTRDPEMWSVDLEMSGTQPQKFNLALENHQKSFSHMEAHVQLKIRENRLKKACTSDALNKSTDVRKNHRLLKLLIEVTCTLKKRIDNINPDFEGYIDVMRLISSYDAELNRFLRNTSSPDKDATEEFVSAHAHRVVVSIEAALKARIVAEWSETKHVVVILEDTCEFVDSSSVAVIVRCVDSQGEILERFVQFIELGRDRSAQVVIPKFKALVADLGLDEKLVGFTYSATVVAPEDMAKFNQEVEELFPSSKFFHYQEHSLKRLLMQALSHVSPCRNFFQTMAELMKFFHSHPNAVIALKNISAELSSGRENRSWEPADLSDGLVTIVKDCYTAILKLLERIIASPKAWDVDAVALAPVILASLKHPPNRFFLCTAAQLMVAVQQLAVLTLENVDLQEWKASSRRVITSLTNIKKYGFNDIKEVASSSFLTRGSSKATSSLTYPDLIDVFNECLDAATELITNRFKDVDDSFFEPSLIAVTANLKTERGQSVESRIHVVTEDLEKLVAQMDFVKLDPLFKNRTPQEALKFILSHDMTTPLAEAVKFLRIHCTIPTKATTARPSTVARLRDYAKDKTQLNSTDALIWMERELLTTMQKDSKFYDDLLESYFVNLAPAP